MTAKRAYDLHHMSRVFRCSCLWVKCQQYKRSSKQHQLRWAVDTRVDHRFLQDNRCINFSSQASYKAQLHWRELKMQQVFILNSSQHTRSTRCLEISWHFSGRASFTFCTQWTQKNTQDTNKLQVNTDLKLGSTSPQTSIYGFSPKCWMQFSIARIQLNKWI
jgi:hypothetical protein